MNSGQETFPGISYTEIYSHQDQFATPAADDTGTSSLHGGGGRIANVALQDICPGHVADHFKAVTFDAVRTGRPRPHRPHRMQRGIPARR